MKRLHIILIVLILPLPHIITAAERDVVRSGEVIVRYDKSLSAVAQEVIRIYPVIKKDLETKFRAEINLVPAVILIRDRANFQRITGKNIVVAIAISAKNLIVIDNSKMKTHPFSLAVTLKHELSHLFLHDYVGQGNLPRWLNEGIAQWASDGIAEILIGDERDLLKKATLSGRFIPLAALANGFPDEEHSLRLSYEESKSVVEYIIKEFGTEGVLSILDNLQKGSEIHEAVLKGLSIPLDELESRWQGYLKRRTTWFTYFSIHIYEIIFAFAALFLTYGFIRFWIRKRAYKDDDGGDEQGTFT
jgi:hypothetical protein